MYERSETITQQRTRNFASPDPAYAGLSATLDDADVVTITFASIEGQSTLRIPGAMLGPLLELGAILADEVPAPEPPEPPSPEEEPPAE